MKAVDMLPKSSCRFGWTRSLRFRLTAWHGGTLTFVVALAAYAFWIGAKRDVAAQHDSLLSMEARYLAMAASARPGWSLNAAELVTEAQRFAATTEADRAALKGIRSKEEYERVLPSTYIYVRLVDPGSHATLSVSENLMGRSDLIASLDALLRRNLPPAGSYALADPAEGPNMRVLTEPLFVSGKPALLQVAIPVGFDAVILRHFLLRLAVEAPIILLVMMFGGWVLVSRTLMPIGRIVTQARLIDANALPAQILSSSETDNEVGELVTTLNDMTTRLHLAFEAQRTFAHAQAQFAEAQQRFVADASHELRTPLTILRGEIELALARRRTRDQYQATLRSAMEEVGRMSRIVNGLTLLARGDAGPILSQEEFECIDLFDLAYRVGCEFRMQIVEKGLTLNLEQPKGMQLPALVSGSPGQLQQLLCNLVENAIKYTPSGGSITISVAIREEGGDSRTKAPADPVKPLGSFTELQEDHTVSPGSLVILEVVDTGMGISAEDLPHIFERFWRADRSRSAGGSGLGLAICAQIVEAHRGKLTAESRLGQGSVFRLQLPYAG